MIDRNDIFPLIIILAISVILFALFLHKRPFTDEGSFCTIAQAVSKGAVLYKDIYNEKAPLPYLIASVFVGLGENPLIVLRVVAFVFFLASVFLLYLLGKINLLQPLENTVVSCFYIITAPLFQSFNFTSEILALPLILFIVWQVKRDDDGRINILTGFFTGMLIFIKQPFIFFILLTLLFALLSKNMRKNFLAGLILSLLFLVLLLKYKGILGPFIENTIFTLKRYDIKSYMRLPYPNEYYQFALLGFVFLASVYSFVRRSTGLYEFLAVLSLLIMGIVRMDAFKMLPFFAVMFYVILRKEIAGSIKNTTFVMVMLSLMSLWHYREILEQRFDQIKAISYTIEAKTGPQESIWVGPHEANIYCLSKRRPSSKYFFLLPWINKPEVLLTLGEDLTRRDPPACIVDVSAFNKATEYHLSSMLPELGIIVKDYMEVHEISGAIIYCKK